MAVAALTAACGIQIGDRYTGNLHVSDASIEELLLRAIDDGRLNE